MPVVRLVGLTLLIWLLTIGWSRGDEITPTTEWINIYSQNSIWEGEPLAEGSVVAVFRPDGVKCGEVVVQLEGWYGLLPCYGEPPESEQVGPSSMADGDTVTANGPLTFTVNGQPAHAVPVSLNGSPVPTSTLVTWTAMGDLWQVDLRGAADGDQLTPVGGHSMPSRTLLAWRVWRRVLVVIGAAIVLCALGTAGTRKGHAGT